MGYNMYEVNNSYAAFMNTFVILYEKNCMQITHKKNKYYKQVMYEKGVKKCLFKKRNTCIYIS